VNPRNSLNSSLRSWHTLQAGDFRISLGRQTKIIGIINLTPDSFSQDGLLAGKNYTLENTVAMARQFIRDGADILDVGGESTRPGSTRISEKEEIKRIVPAIRVLVKKIKMPISVDTYKPSVAKAALDCGVSIINNIMGTKPDTKLLKIVKEYKAAIVLMHIRGTPQTMQKNIHYRDLIGEIMEELRESMEKCLEIGIKSDRIILDPGIGFGKTVGQNLEIINRLKDFKSLDKPLLIGTSRKSFIGKLINKDVADRLLGTAASVVAAILNGAHIVRVHDVREIKDAVKITDAILHYA